MVGVLLAAVAVGVLTGLYGLERLFDWLAEQGRRNRQN